MFVNIAHQRSRMWDRRLRPEIPARIDGAVFSYLGDLEIDQQAIIASHEIHIARITSRDHWLGHEHRFCHSEAESLRAMQGNKTIRHRNQTIGAGTAEQLVNQNHVRSANRFCEFGEVFRINIATAGFDNEGQLVIRLKRLLKRAKNADGILAVNLAVEIEHEKENEMVFGDL